MGVSVSEVYGESEGNKFQDKTQACGQMA